VLSQGGFGSIWINAGQAYRFAVYSFGGINCASGTLQYTVDGITGSTGSVSTNVTFSTTPLFNIVAQNQLFVLTLTGNATSLPMTATGILAPSHVIFQIIQDATGGRTFAWPSNVIGGCDISSAAGVLTQLEVIWDGTYGRAVGPCETSDNSTNIQDDPGSFTGSAYKASVLNQVGGINNGSEFAHFQGGLFADDALSTGISVPSSANKHQFNALGAYAVCDAVSSPLSTNNNCVGIYASMRMTRNGSSAWAFNPLIGDTAGMSGHAMYNGEFDQAVNGAPSTLIPLIITGILSGSATIPPARPRNQWCGPAVGNCSAIITIAHTLNSNGFPVGIEFEPGEVTGDAFRFAPTCGSGTCGSATAAFTGFSTGTTGHSATVGADSNGNLAFSSGGSGVSMITTNGTHLLCSTVLPVIASGFNGGTIGNSGANANGSCSFMVTIGGTGSGSAGTVTLPAAAVGWACSPPQNVTPRGAYIQQTSSGTTSATFTNYGTTIGTPVNWTNGDNILIICTAF
jgi:hypothetical protein